MSAIIKKKKNGHVHKNKNENFNEELRTVHMYIIKKKIKYLFLRYWKAVVTTN